MTEADLAAILDACKPVAVMMIGGTVPSSQQENANRAWSLLGKKMGFDAMTARPVAGKGQRFFTAVPNETDSQRAEREEREREAARCAEVEQLTKEIADRRQRLATLQADSASAETLAPLMHMLEGKL